MRFFLAALLLLSSAASLPAAHPQWSELANLFGKEKDSPEVAALVRMEMLGETTKGPSGNFTPDDYSYSLLYRENKIETIVLKVTPPPQGYAQENWRSYAQPLPGGLAADDGRAEVVKKLGEPTRPGGDTWLLMDWELWVHFNQEESAISELYVSRLEAEEAARPALEFERLELRQGRHFALLRLTNRTAAPISYKGYSPTQPILSFQRRAGRHWFDHTMAWCGTGLEPRELGAGESIEIPVSLAAYDLEPSLGTEGRSEPAKPVRAGLDLRHAGAEETLRVWTDPFNLPEADRD